MTNFKFNAAGDYKAEFTNYVDKIIEKTKRGDLGRASRMQEIERLTDAYIAVTGEVPDSYEIERLTDAILNEELSDPHPDKISRNEYPFMSDWQLDVRHDKEASADAAGTVGTDGRNHRKPVRRKRTNSENRFTDKYARARNKERQRRYNEFTKVQPVKHWNMYTGEIYEGSV